MANDVLTATLSPIVETASGKIRGAASAGFVSAGAGFGAALRGARDA